MKLPFPVWPSLCGALLLAGCAVGPNYRRPEFTGPATLAHAGELSSTNGPLAAAWWQDFGDSLLNQLVAQASTNNLDLRHAQARLREARALWTESRFDFAPTVRNENRYEKSQLAESAARNRDRQSELFRAGFDATWELDLWGRVRREVEAARATVESVEASRDAVRISIQAEVAVNYLQLRGAQAELAVANRNATNQAQTLKLAEALRDGGQGTQLDVARARSLLHATLATIPPVETEIERAIHRLAVLCGLPPGRLPAQLQTPGELPKAPSQLSLPLPEELLRRRPDVRAAERALAAATARIGVEVGGLFPRVSFVGSLALEAASLPGLTAPGADAYSFGPRLSWAAFDLGRVRQRIHAADARSEQSLALYEQTVLLALEEAENSLVALSRARQRLTYLTEAERSAAEASQLARQRYSDGIADYLSVLDAERTLLNLQEQLVATQTQAATRLIAVYKAFAASAPASPHHE